MSNRFENNNKPLEQTLDLNYKFSYYEPRRAPSTYIAEDEFGYAIVEEFPFEDIPIHKKTASTEGEFLRMFLVKGLNYSNWWIYRPESDPIKR